MRAHIGPDLIRKLPTQNVDIFDTRLAGFTIRCRASGVHSYRLLLAYGVAVTLGRVGKMTPAEARIVAEGKQRAVAAEASRRQAADPSLTARAARAQARETLRHRRDTCPLTWRTFR